VLEGYIDESGDDKTRLFTLACIVSHGGMWWWFEQAWLELLRKRNEELAKQDRPQISRYKAADCSSRLYEFSDWTTDEQMEFSEKLLNIFRRHPIAIISYTISLTHIADEMPEARKKPQAIAYAFLLQKIMARIADTILSDSRFEGHNLSLIHDRTTRCDSVLLDAFNGFVNDGTQKHRERFTTIAPMGWEACTLLQPADLIAYQNFKLIERDHAGQKRHKFMELLLDLDSIGGRGAEIPLEGIKELNSEARTILYKLARIPQKCVL